jgi:putative Holliday junction resolvase
MRVLGLDYGTVRIGVAVSDPAGIIAQPRGFVNAVPRKHCISQIASLCSELDVRRIVIGLPKHMNGDEGESAEGARTLGNELEAATGIHVSYIDERLTTVSAENILKEGNVRAPGRKDKVDSVAAAIILQNYLDIHSV